MTTTKRYFCEGCGEWIDPKDVLTFFNSLAHETATFEGEPDPCGEVKVVDDSQDSTKKL